MCGIALLFDSNESGTSQTPYAETLRRRGPDSYCEINVKGTTFAAAVLHIQGTTIEEQPCVDESSGNILLWNGEVFGGLEIIDGQSDTVVVSSLLTSAMDSCSSMSEMTSLDVVTSALARIDGPYAFVFYHADSGMIVYGRDPFGRRSLVALHAKERMKEKDEENEEGGRTKETGCKLLRLQAPPLRLLLIVGTRFRNHFVFQGERREHFRWIYSTEGSTAAWPALP